MKAKKTQMKTESQNKTSLSAPEHNFKVVSQASVKP